MCDMVAVLLPSEWNAFTVTQLSVYRPSTNFCSSRTELLGLYGIFDGCLGTGTLFPAV